MSDADQIAIRRARPEDGPRLAEIDHLAWTRESSPVDRPPADRVFPGDLESGDTLVAELDGQIAGYTVLGRHLPVEANAHVGLIRGVTVDPAYQRRGVGRAMVEAAKDLAVERGLDKVALRVFSTNPGAVALYRSAGFTLEGILRREFRFGETYVDDFQMAWWPPRPKG